MKKILSIILVLFLALSVTNAQTDNDDRARIYKAMDKGRNGEDLTIGVIGGSITQGHAASSESKRWANLMTDWWKTTFPTSNVTLINAGWGGTGSDIGAHRAYDDLLQYNPDFIVVEFSVNDYEGDLAKKMMEGIVQQVLTAENTPGLMLLMLKQDNGTTAQASHKPVAEHYQVPYVSFADLIDAKVTEDGVALSSIFVDGLHPNNTGMAYIAELIAEHLDSIYSTLPAAGNLPAINTTLPTPIVGDTYSKTFQYFPTNIVPLSNNQWVKTTTGWESETVGDQVDFKVKGNAVSLVFTQNIASNRGRAEVWVDDGAKTTIDAFMNEDWGTRYAFSLVQEGLGDGEHILHIRIIDETSTSGNYVELTRILVAGNVGSAAPIAITSSSVKTVIGREVELIGSESFDPDGDEIDAFSWAFEEKPAGSTVEITNANDSVASFTPDFAGDYVVSLNVTAGSDNSVPAIKKVKVVASNNIPVAVPGNDTISALKKYFTFDGSKSYDADDDALIYQWELESAPEGSRASIIGENEINPQIKIDKEGDFVVSLVVYDSLDYSEKKTITIEGRDGYTNINDTPSKRKEINVYPNPAKDEVNIEYYLTEAEPVVVEIYSTNGKKVYKMVNTTTAKGVNNQQVSLKGLKAKSGVYFVKVTSNSKTQSTKITLL